MRFGFIHAWWDFWVGAYYDRKALRLYVLPLPTLGFWVERSLPPQFASPEELFGPVPPGIVGADSDVSIRQRMRGRRLDVTPTVREIAERLGLDEQDVRDGMDALASDLRHDGEE